ncbi:MAG: 2-oxoacid:acceptor oxidoreductase family protein [Candidatus Bathyarchaeota archaeon]|nr:MAG: 2-oxoacid:acceptor oxidoreductase family protein [Candidatus Bathyarchaeota archaeon]
MVDEIRLHGMGGQGVVAAGELLAIAASLEDKFCRAVPMYGSARRGAPVLAFVQIGEESEATRSMIYHPKYLLVLDPTLPETTSLTEGLKDGGVIVFNTPKPAEEAARVFNAKLSKFGVVDATGIAERVIGRPIPNTTMLGAFVRVTGLLKLESVCKAVDKRFNPRIAGMNKEAVRAGYEEVEIVTY